jgi:hypothetical protein
LMLALPTTMYSSSTIMSLLCTYTMNLRLFTALHCAEAASAGGRCSGPCPVGSDPAARDKDRGRLVVPLAGEVVLSAAASEAALMAASSSCSQ